MKVVEAICNYFDECDERRGQDKTRDTYKSKGKQTKLSKNMEVEDLIQEEAIDGYFVSSEGNYIPESLSAYYFYMFHGRVPDEWMESFCESADLGSKALGWVNYVPHHKIKS